ncbi:MAG: 16S rRNA (cytosine1407-C5)-methyltransferase [Candidatus Peregrinibacteria bacterium Greene0416_19]|nr:MAG: 16S rRNA (cytosine1407-C5)-methyltransferase [Candidatus Peregrinibacteria bacterium Greene0416_19]
MDHPFDRYATFTDLAALKAASERPLRKSLRVNTLKTSVDAFSGWAAGKGWQLTPVPWCPEGFFIDREDRETALGKDLLHLLGHTYMQEAASMLPPVLLDPQPGDEVLDMSAAPGSKTTQMAARMSCPTPTPQPPPPSGEGVQGVGAGFQEQRFMSGVILANDVQEKRLWTLKSALHRCGTTNVIMTRKVGQYFAKHMTERFDRVLVDAPCTAQGTSRKDSDALSYCSADNIGKMAKLQRELLEAGVHAAKVGGTIVYSTCTLTPEENEEVVRSILNKFSDQLECIDPPLDSVRQAQEDSAVVQRALGFDRILPTARMWPHVCDVEGFFCAVLKKTAPTRAKEWVDFVRFQEELMPQARQEEIGAILEGMYGTSFLRTGDVLFERGDHLLLATEDVRDFRLPVVDYAVGIPFATRLDQLRLRISHELATLRGNEATMLIVDIDDAQLEELLGGRDTTCDASVRGDCVMKYRGIAVGMGLAKEGVLKNRLPRWIVRKS